MLACLGLLAGGCGLHNGGDGGSSVVLIPSEGGCRFQGLDPGDAVAFVEDEAHRYWGPFSSNVVDLSIAEPSLGQEPEPAESTRRPVASEGGRVPGAMGTGTGRVSTAAAAGAVPTAAGQARTPTATGDDRVPTAAGADRTATVTGEGGVLVASEEGRVASASAGAGSEMASARPEPRRSPWAIFRKSVARPRLLVGQDTAVRLWVAAVPSARVRSVLIVDKVDPRFTVVSAPGAKSNEVANDGTTLVWRLEPPELREGIAGEVSFTMRARE